MFKLYCDVCGKEVIPEEGTLSWRDDGNALSDFRITHKQDQNHSETRYVSSFTSGCLLVLQVTQNSSNCSLIIGIKGMS